MLSLDSSPEMERLQIALWRRMSPLEKARAVDGLSRATQELALAGIRQRHPHASERECRLRLAVLKFGPRLAVRVYPGRDDSTGVSLRAQGSPAQLRSLDAWQMRSIYTQD